ncbi:glucosamine inositolphosphorylceramide transferase family protein [Alteromonas ponticola]|uniref:Glucosamine inositolphosphorylceramide transferase 1 N-terminal domain-containing protein n=1 Tax=Alteromonas ponticola TaxID=2720613 RepID=A0ABX1R0R4_9ALTE|nr:hypothetical protein [Alteromonas ponticola]NMH59052.1 hypothetical protein [Alteromonas ponticola]
MLYGQSRHDNQGHDEVKTLKVGFLVDGLKVSSYIHDLVKHVSDCPQFDDPVILTGHCLPAQPKSLKDKIRSAFEDKKIKDMLQSRAIDYLIGLTRKLERKNLKKNKPCHFNTFNLESFSEISVVKLEGEWSKSKLFLSFSPQQVQKIKGQNLDCIIRCGSGILKGDVLEASTFGILSFHHGDNRVNRGGPSGFWEVLYDQPSSGFIIQQLSNELDGGKVLVRGNIMTRSNWMENNAVLLIKSNFFMKKLLDDIAKNRALPEEEDPSLHDHPLLKLDSVTPIVKYLYKVHAKLVKQRVMSKLFGPDIVRWSVAFSAHDNFKKSLWRYKEIENPDGRFLADPFVFTHNDRTLLFVEDYFYAEQKGKVSAYEIVEGELVNHGVILEEPFHLSFPFVFEANDKVYMIPESHSANEIRLYECIDFPLKWRFKKTLMDNVSAADTMLLQDNDRWYMFTNICSAGTSDHHSELHIYWSEQFDSQSWTPISSGNPVIFDSERARNGGFFKHNECLFRINQIHDKNHYGKAFGINKVSKLSADEYVETRVKDVYPNFKPDLDSTHHFNANETIAVIDYCRNVKYKTVKK